MLLTTQVWLSLLLGVAGIAYLFVYEQAMMVSRLRKYGEAYIIRNQLQWWRQRDTVMGATVPAVEELLVRGVPMLFVQSKLQLALVLFVTNALFVLGHVDMRSIGSRRCVLRYIRGLFYGLPALFGSLLGCIALHVGWNLMSALRYRNHYPGDRVTIWTAGRMEIMLTPKPGLANSPQYRQRASVRR